MKKEPLGKPGGSFRCRRNAHLCLAVDDAKEKYRMTDKKKNDRLEKDPKPKNYSDKACIDAMDAENFNTVEYQEDGQGGPRKGVSDEEE
jgi:hypothetical protein